MVLDLKLRLNEPKVLFDPVMFEKRNFKRFIQVSCFCNVYFTLELSVRLRYRRQSIHIVINTGRLLVGADSKVRII